MSTGKIIGLINALAGDGGSGGGGSSGGVLVVTDTDGTLNKTFKEINDAFNNGGLPVVIYDGMIWYPMAPPDVTDLLLSFKAINLTATDSGYYIYGRDYISESENDYPVYDV